jgi:hypothetical protein
MTRTTTHGMTAQRAMRWLALLLVAGLAWACRPAYAGGDPPGRVGRVTESQGQSWVYDTEANEWIALERNRPITSGDRIAVDADARLELRIGSTTVRLAGGSDFELRQLDDDHIDMALQSGGAAVRVRTPAVAREVQLSTPEGRFTSSGAGHYRVDRRDDASTASALSGEVRFESDDSALTVPAGRSAEFWREGPSNATHYSWSELPQDEFGDWVARANREDDRVAAQNAPQYVSPEMTGWEDLDRNGRWDTHPDYGPIWMPTTVASGWAPYRYGHWAYVRPWGWTWVDDAPWGFAPFHYGRWLVVGGRWCWAPGRYVARPVYAPALVAWIGGPGYSATVVAGGSPYVGWVPLAPREPYYPHYATGGAYWRSVNYAQLNLFPGNTPHRPPAVPIVYSNQRVPNAVSVVPSTSLVAHRPVAPIVAQVDPTVRNTFSTQPTRTHVPPPGVARPIAVPGSPLAQPPRSPVQPPPATPRTPSPALMGQPSAPPAAAMPDPRRERRPVPPTVSGQPAPNAPTVRMAPGLSRPAPPAQVAPPQSPQQAMPPRATAPVPPAVQSPSTSVQPRPPSPAPAIVQPQPRPVQPPPAQQHQPQTPPARRFEPGERERREPPSRGVMGIPQQPRAAIPQAPLPQVRMPERAVMQPRSPQAQLPRAAPARPEMRERIPEWRGHPGRPHMQ